jgi:ribose 5-phosphate isomerase B
MKRDPHRRQLITERDVRAAAGTGKALDATGAIVTPAARDLATQLGVTLSLKAEAPPTPAASAHPIGKVVLGSDHGGFKLKESLKPLISGMGFEVTDVGSDSTDPVDYPVFAARVAEQVASGDARAGIMIDGAGIGSAMVANKIKGARAALCYDLTTARSAREHNNANVLTLGGGLIGERLAQEIVRVFLTTDFAGGRHAGRVAMIDALDS